MAVIEAANSIGMRRSWRLVGAPVDGTTLADVADPGDILIDKTAKKVYVNTNTKASPTWSQVVVDGVDFGGKVVFTGARTDDVIDFSGVTINSTGSNGPTLIRAGTYDSPIANADEDQSGFIRLYGETSANGTSYDRGIFVALKTTGLKGIFPISGLAEIKAQSGAGPKSAMAGQFITILEDATSKLATLGGNATAGMYGVWAKVGGHGSAEASSGSRVAALWLDNQLQGSVLGEEYACFITTGGTKPDAVFGFETTGVGWANLFYFDETAFDQDPVGAIRGTPNQTATCDGSLKVLLDTTTLFIPLYDAISLS